MNRPTVKASQQAGNPETTIASREFATISTFCAIGLLTSLNVMLRLPELSALLAVRSM